MKVLIAEDNPFYVCMIEASLKGWGYEVVRAPGDRRWHAKLIVAMIDLEGDRSTLLSADAWRLL